MPGPYGRGLFRLRYSGLHFLEKCGHSTTSPQSFGNDFLAGEVPLSFRLDLQSDSMGLMSCKLGISDLIGFGLKADKSNSLSDNLQAVGLVPEVNGGLNAQMRLIPIPVENHVSIKSNDSDNDYEHDPHLSVSKGFSKSKRRQPKPI